MLDEVTQRARLFVIRLPDSQVVAMGEEQFGKIGGVCAVILMARRREGLSAGERGWKD